MKFNILLTTVLAGLLIFAPIVGATCESEPTTPDVPEVAPAPAPDVAEVDESDPNMFWRKTVDGWVNCDTSWKRATYPECFGRPYALFLQNNSTGNVAIPVIRWGFDMPNIMTNHPGE
jgi:hypothetical protein